MLVHQIILLQMTWVVKEQDAERLVDTTPVISRVPPQLLKNTPAAAAAVGSRGIRTEFSWPQAAAHYCRQPLRQLMRRKATTDE